MWNCIIVVGADEKSVTARVSLIENFEKHLSHLKNISVCMITNVIWYYYNAKYFNVNIRTWLVKEMF